MQRRPGLPAAELDHVAGAGDAERSGEDAQIAQREQIPAAFAEGGVVRAGVHRLPVRGAEIFRPLVLDMDQRPLPAAELEVLEPGELEKVLLGPNHPIRLSVTPSGSAASSTVIT